MSHFEGWSHLCPNKSDVYNIRLWLASGQPHNADRHTLSFFIMRCLVIIYDMSFSFVDVLMCVTYSRLLVCHEDRIAGQVVACAGSVCVVGV